jgi:acetyl-CoA carboxylase biotin carboxyl carrier protein
MIDDNLTPLGYGQPLLRLSQAREVGGNGLDGPAGQAKERAADGLIAITAPSDGVFHRRPAPDSPCYVQEGSEVSAGSVLGLVEVMKSFAQIVYGGTGLPERGTVVEIPVDDAAEVAFGQTLFLVRPG